MFASEMINKIQMMNTLVPDEKLVVGGQPTIADLKLLHSLGVKQVVNLRPNTEKNDFDEPQLLKDLGIEYHSIPLTDISTFNKDSAFKVKCVLDLKQPTLVHCASGNRVGALIALKAFWLEGLSPQESLDKGLQAGLTKLEPQVSQLLGL
ncbi:MAG: sulfur transferase domain-containing protein [Thalassotalea sp.]|nr:sulfur transferase domain-containing protein [Thalassotalea sp.]